MTVLRWLAAATILSGGIFPVCAVALLVDRHRAGMARLRGAR